MTTSKPQLIWTDEMVTACSLHGHARGALTRKQARLHARLAQRAVGGERKQLGADDLAALARASSLSTTQVDIVQLAAAARFVSDTDSAAEQEDRLRRVLDCVRVLSTVGAPRLGRARLAAQMFAAAHVPWLALRGLDDDAVARAYQEVAALLNTGGVSDVHMGDCVLTLTVADGAVLHSAWHKPSVFAEIARAVTAALTWSARAQQAAR